MNEAVFKTTVMGGFNKSDVLEFIDKQDSQFKAKEKDLLGRINRLVTDYKNESNRGEELEQKVKDLKAEIENEKVRRLEATEQLQAISLVSGQDKNSMSTEISRRDAEIDKLRDEVIKLSRRLEVADAKSLDSSSLIETYEQKLELMENTEEQIGRAILKSQQMADEIVGVAKTDAAEIIRVAQEAAETAVSQAKESVSRRFDDAREKLDWLLSGVAQYKQQIEETRENVTGFFTSVDTIFESMHNTAVDTAQKFENVFKTEMKTEIDAENVEEKEITTENVVADETALKFDFSKSHNDFSKSHNDLEVSEN